MPPGMEGVKTPEAAAGKGMSMSDAQKKPLPEYLTATREAVIWKTEGLSEYDVRRPMTPTVTGMRSGNPNQPAHDGRWWTAHRSAIEAAARAARARTFLPKPDEVLTGCCGSAPRT